MAKKELSAEYVSGFCTELGLLLRAGITVSDGIATLSEDFKDHTGFLSSLRESTENGATLYEALIKTDSVPSYMLDMILLGERAGRLEETLFALSGYYDKRSKLASGIRSAIIYPLVLIIMMAAVSAVLFTQVLPIFADVFSQTGSSMSPLALSLMRFGQGLSSASSIIIWVLAGICLICVVVFVIRPARHIAARLFRKQFGGSGVFKLATTAQFASAMTTAISSGLGPEESVELSSKVIRGIRKFDRGLQKCRELLSHGESLEKGLMQAGIFSARDSRLLSLGIRTGSADTVMAEIARRSEEKALDGIESLLSKIEPTMVAIISLIVGTVLLSVMLPLMGIMSSIG